MILVYILYDSINHTIFASQVWQLLLNLIKQDQTLKVILVSFETKKNQFDYMHPNIKIIIIQRYRYLGVISLIWNSFKLKKILKPLLLNKPFKIIARGPFAGLIALKLNLPACNDITIQARGLAAQEYCYSHQTKNWFIRFLIKLRVRQLFSLEKKVYRKGNNIECVSTALGKYLTQIYGTKQDYITIAKQDLPAKFTATQLTTWRTRLRQKLNISESNIVYCYSGSNHLWQCPHQTINFFKTKLAQDLNIFLLILTPQPTFFEKIITQAQIPTNHYLVLAVPYQAIYQYLATADYGLLFREPHIINWVSRPTKALEYQAAGLKIIHNHTIAFLSE